MQDVRFVFTRLSNHDAQQVKMVLYFSSLRALAYHVDAQ